MRAETAGFGFISIRAAIMGCLLFNGTVSADFLRLFDMDLTGCCELIAYAKTKIEEILFRLMTRFGEWASPRNRNHFFDDIYDYFDRVFSRELASGSDQGETGPAVRRVTGNRLFTLKKRVAREADAMPFRALAEAVR